MNNDIFCNKCGLQQNGQAQIAIIPTQSWKHLFKVLYGELPEYKCERCDNKISFPTFLLFYSSALNKGIIFDYFDNYQGLPENLESEIQEKLGSITKVKVTTDIKIFQGFIQEHILFYKPLLIDLMSSLQNKESDSFIAKKWQEITPEVFASAFVAATGLVPNIELNAINIKTGESLDIELFLKELEYQISFVQFKVWKNIVLSDKDENLNLETLLQMHVRNHAIYGDSVSDFELYTLNILTEAYNEKISVLNAYCALAIYATASEYINKHNVFENDWAQFYIEAELNDFEKSSLLPWRISPERAKHILSKKSVWNYIAFSINEFFANIDTANLKNDAYDFINKLDSIASKIGYNDIVKNILNKSIKIDLSPDIKTTWKDIENYINSLSEKIEVNDDLVIGNLLRPLNNFFVQSGNVEILEKTFEKILHCVKTYEKRASLECWLGECTKLMRAPLLFIKKVGTEPRDWEFTLNIHNRICLGNERANALRLLNDQSRALELTNELIELTKDKSECVEEYFILAKNRAILLRELGAQDESLKEFEELLKKAPIEEFAQLLESYAGTLLFLRRPEDAVDRLKQAIEIGNPEDNDHKQQLFAHLASALTMCNRTDEALEILSRIKHERILLSGPIAAAYANILIRGEDLNEKHFNNIDQIINNVIDYLNIATSYGDINQINQLTKLVAILTDEIYWDSAEELLQNCLKITEDDPEIIVRLALHAYEKDNIGEAKRLFSLLPDAIIKNFGNVQDISIGYDITSNIRLILEQLTQTAIIKSRPWDEIRFIAEMKRDIIGRSKFANINKVLNDKEDKIKTGDIYLGISEPLKQGDFVILEWISSASKIYCLLTAVNKSGEIETIPIKSPEQDIYKLRKNIMNLLSVWHKGRQADPFDNPDWINFKKFYRQSLSQLIPDGIHIIVIEEQSLVGIPWHVALAPNWSCSYASGWSDIANASKSKHNENLKIGLFSTIRYKDSAALENAFSVGINNIQNYCHENNLSFTESINSNADIDGFKYLISNCDAVMIFCHGFVNPKTREVAMLISNNGSLPPTYPPRKDDDSHLLSWRDMQLFENKTSIVLSAACSSGLQWKAGADEQMGIYNGLRHTGTKAIIAPRWDVVAEDVIPILQDVFFRYIKGEALNMAVYNACKNAENHVPKWLAWSISLEGSLK